MISVTQIIAIAVIFALALNWGIRIGKAMQKEIPPVPLAEASEKVAGIVKKIGKRTVRLVHSMEELKALKKEKQETNVFD